jgi:tetratricopeptide (TPR) repeat protein
MKLLSFIRLSPSELQILKKVTIFSLSICLAIVACFWIFFYIKFSSTLKIETHRGNSLLPIDLEAHTLTAERYLNNGNPEKAIPHLQRILANKKKNLQTQKDLAYAYLDAGKYPDALKQYNSIIENEPPESISVDIYARKGITLFYSGNIELSKTVLTECLSRVPGNAEAECFLGQIAATIQSDSLEARRYLEKATQTDSSYVEGWYQLGRYWMQKEAYMKAREYFLKAIHINPLHGKSHSGLGMVYYYLNHPQLAKISYQTAIALNPYDFNTQYNLGELFYSTLADTTAALISFKKAITENPNHCEANFKTGLICLQNGMSKEAVGYFKKALESDPGNIRMLIQLAVAFEKSELREDAVRIYTKILSIDELNNLARHKIKTLS